MLSVVWAFGAYRNITINTKIVENKTATTTAPMLQPEEVLAATAPTTISTPTKATTTPTKPKQVVVKKIVTATTTEDAPVVPKSAAEFIQINETARKAAVNILCTAKGSDLNPISGTGVVISPDGLVVTNAHVGQYFLLKDFRQKDFMDCVIRTGSPAYPRYHAELVFLSPTWANANKTILKDANPKGTGEYDYSFLRITDAIDGSELPKFNYIPGNTREKIQIGEPVLLVGYPAGFLGGISILQGVNATSAMTLIQDVFTFKANTIDLLAVGGTVLSQKGASGGGVVDQDATLIGIISTSSNGDTTSDRQLNAISMAYINRKFYEETNGSLYDLLTGDIKAYAKKFQETKVPELFKTLTDVFNTTN
jgi:hypothetical protein